MTASEASSAPLPRTARSLCRVTYRMTDQMGVVYYANYFELFEIGRTDLLRGTGLTYRDMERDGYLLPVVHAACDYRLPARYDDVLVVTTRLERLTRLRLDFEYEVTLEGNPEAMIASGNTRHAIIGADGRPRRLSPEWMKRLGGETRS